MYVMILLRTNTERRRDLMETSIIIAFLIYAIVNAFTPGPGNILALTTMTRYGWHRGKALFLGIFSGYYSVQVLCALFIYGLDTYLNPLLYIMKYAGGIYISWLVFSIILSKPSNDQMAKKPSFWMGFVLQFINIKIFLFGITALTAYVVPYYNSLGMLIFFEIIIASIGTMATLSWIFFGAIFQKTYIKYFKGINFILGLILFECAYELVFK